MKFIHLSDPHILPRSQKVAGVDVCVRLDAAVDSINRKFSDAAFCMVTGDLTDEGDEISYKEVCSILDRLQIPWHGLMGNHDDGDIARQVLSDHPWHADGSLQYEVLTDVGQFIVLDSSIESSSGYLNEQRLDWLDQRLNVASELNRDAYIFMHHVPFDIEIPWLDRIKMENGADLWQVLQRYGNIRHMFFGHVHRPVHGSWHGIPFSTVRSTAHQVALSFEDASHGFIAESPSYAVVFATKNCVLVHDHNFLDEQLPIIVRR